MTDGKTVRLDLSGSCELWDLAQTVSEHVARLAGLDDDAIHWIGMSVREAVINGITHGNGGDESKRVYLEFELLTSGTPGLQVKVRDQGQGFDPASLPDPLATENLLKSGGRGVFLIRSFMDEVAFERTPQGSTEVVMVKRMSSGSAG
jgi:serine/threonine-protein kinase RsbW